MRIIYLLRTLAITSALILGVSGAAFGEDEAPAEAADVAAEVAEEAAEAADVAAEAEQE
jgi:hypothetical protein